MKILLSIECILLCALLPLLYWLFPVQTTLYLVLWGVTAYALANLLREKISWREEWWGHARTARPWVMMVLRVVLAAGLITAVTLTYAPERWLALPQQRPMIWLMIMVLYPILSALPQEIIFRSFFFRRYQSIAGSPVGMIALSGGAFGLTHLAFGNWVAPVLSTVAGLVLSWAYTRHKSLLLVWVEHALYGQLIFTLGLGWYFYIGSRLAP